MSCSSLSTRIYGSHLRKDPDHFSGNEFCFKFTVSTGEGLLSLSAFLVAACFGVSVLGLDE